MIETIGTLHDLCKQVINFERRKNETMDEARNENSTESIQNGNVID